MERNRPLGISLISLFLIIIGIIAFLAAAGMAFLATMSSEQFLEMIEGEPSDWFLENYSLVFGTIGVAFLLQGMVALLLAYGFWKAKPWAWVGGHAVGIGLHNHRLHPTLGHRLQRPRMGLSAHLVPVLALGHNNLPHQAKD